MRDSILIFLESNPWLNLVFLALALLSVIISLALHYFGKRQKIPVFNKKSFTLIKDSLSELEGLSINFMGSEVANLTTTKISIWNKGKDTIDRRDVAPLDPVRVEVEGDYKILQSKIIYESNDINNFKICRADDLKVEIDFDYFYKNEGIVVQIYHTSPSDENIKIAGTIKGAGKFKNAVIPEDQSVDKWLGPLVDRIRPKNRILNITVFVLIFPIIFISFVVLQLYDSVRRFSRKVPKEFEFKVS